MGRSQVLYNRISAQIRADRGGGGGRGRGQQGAGRTAAVGSNQQTKKYSPSNKETAASLQRKHGQAVVKKRGQGGSKGRLPANPEDVTSNRNGENINASLPPTTQGLHSEEISQHDLQAEEQAEAYLSMGQHYYPGANTSVLIADDESKSNVYNLHQRRNQPGLTGDNPNMEDYDPTVQQNQALCSRMALSFEMIPTSEIWRIPPHLVDTMYSASEKRRQQQKIDAWNERKHRQQEEQRRRIQHRIAIQRQQQLTAKKKTEVVEDQKQEFNFETDLVELISNDDDETVQEQHHTEQHPNNEHSQRLQQEDQGILKIQPSASSISSASASVFLKPPVSNTNNSSRRTDTIMREPKMQINEEFQSQQQSPKIVRSSPSPTPATTTASTNNSTKSSAVPLSQSFESSRIKKDQNHDAPTPLQDDTMRHYQQPTAAWLAHNEERNHSPSSNRKVVSNDGTSGQSVRSVSNSGQSVKHFNTEIASTTDFVSTSSSWYSQNSNDTSTTLPSPLVATITKPSASKLTPNNVSNNKHPNPDDISSTNIRPPRQSSTSGYLNTNYRAEAIAGGITTATMSMTLSGASTYISGVSDQLSTASTMMADDKDMNQENHGRYPRQMINVADETLQQQQPKQAIIVIDEETERQIGLLQTATTEDTMDQWLESALATNLSENNDSRYREQQNHYRSTPRDDGDDKEQHEIAELDSWLDSVISEG